MECLPKVLCTIIGKYASLCDRKNLRQLYPELFRALDRYEIAQVRAYISHYFECDMDQLDAFLIRQRACLSGPILGAALVHELGVFTLDDMVHYGWIRLYIHFSQIAKKQINFKCVYPNACKELKRLFSRLLRSNEEETDATSEFVLSSRGGKSDRDGSDEFDGDKDNNEDGGKKLAVYAQQTPIEARLKQRRHQQLGDELCILYAPHKTNILRLSKPVIRALDQRRILRHVLEKRNIYAVDELARWHMYGFCVRDMSDHLHCVCERAARAMLFETNCECETTWCDKCLEVAQLRRSPDARNSVCRACTPAVLLSNGIDTSIRARMCLQLPIMNVDQERTAFLASRHAITLANAVGTLRSSISSSAHMQLTTLLFFPGALVPRNQKMTITFHTTSHCMMFLYAYNVETKTNIESSESDAIAVCEHDGQSTDDTNMYSFTRIQSQDPSTIWVFAFSDGNQQCAAIDENGVRFLDMQTYW